MQPAGSANLITNRNLRLLIIGQLISAIGDHFYLLAMPWLALQLTRSALVASTVLAAASVPRALLLLVGGVATDRYSARLTLIVANGLLAVVMAGLGATTLAQFTPLWFLYALALVAGVADAFAYPAVNSLLPGIVQSDDLETGNIFLQGTFMVSGVVGPALAGLLISLFGSSAAEQSSLIGIGLAFLIDSATYVIGIALFWQMQVAAPKTNPDESIISSLGYVFDEIKADPRFRYLFLMILALGLLLTGSITVGLPVLAVARLPGGAAVLGFLTAAYGAGMLGGMAGLKFVPKPPAAISGLVVLAVFAVFPVGLMVLGVTALTPLAITTLLIMGAANGYVTIYVLSWLQRKTPVHMLGRIMGVVMFAIIGLAPVSQIVIGYLLDLDIEKTFVGAGALVLLLLLVTATRREMRSLD